jgi:hypothetical protein
MVTDSVFGSFGTFCPKWFARGQILSPFSAAFRPLFRRFGSLACIYTFCASRPTLAHRVVNLPI